MVIVISKLIKYKQNIVKRKQETFMIYLARRNLAGVESRQSSNFFFWMHQQQGQKGSKCLIWTKRATNYKLHATKLSWCIKYMQISFFHLSDYRQKYVICKSYIKISEYPIKCILTLMSVCLTWVTIGPRSLTNLREFYEILLRSILFFFCFIVQINSFTLVI